MSIFDDFEGGVLDPACSIEVSAGVFADLGLDATDAFLTLVALNGAHNVWNTNDCAGAMQATAETNFQIETRFLNRSTEKYQMQGLLADRMRTTGSRSIPIRTARNFMPTRNEPDLSARDRCTA